MDLIVYDFNPHFRKGSDSTERAKTDEPYDFNPHFRKGSDCIISRIEQKWNYFNPHFRKGSDEGKWIIPSSVHISIHTSAREVTKCKQYRRINSLFQSTLPQGKWPSAYNLFRWYDNFNPHFHKGSDRLIGLMQWGYLISIHTSTREVTLCILVIYYSCIFQSTLPQGKWLYWRTFPVFLKGISIHTSTREVTEHKPPSPVPVPISIHTSTREVTRS